MDCHRGNARLSRGLFYRVNTMIGQGRPTGSFLLARIPRSLFRAALVLISLFIPTGAWAENVAARLRIEWGGGSERVWQGSISLSTGRLFGITALGLEADEVSTIAGDEQQIILSGRSPRVYDGLDVSFEAPRDATLRIDLAAGDEGTVEPVEIVVGDLLDNAHNSALDKSGNRLSARRAPGDRLRVKFDRDHLIFAAGETWNLEVEPAMGGIPPESRLRLSSRLLATDGTQAWIDEREWTSPAEGALSNPVSLSVPMPQADGVYDLVLQMSKRSLTDRLGLRVAGEERRVQVVVVSDQRAGYTSPDDQPAFDVLAEIDPANPAWWERIATWQANMPKMPSMPALPAMPSIPNMMRRGPLGIGAVSPLDHPLGKLAQLGPGGREPDTAWEAYPLPVSRPGQPHIIELEYPADVPQTLGLSIIEPNAAGIVTPIGLDSGMYRPPEARDNVPAVERHRLIFWPRTNSPLLLVTNRRHGTRAVYGKLRLLGPKANIWSPLVRTTETFATLPRAVPPDNPSLGRMLLAYYDRPLFPENFGAPQALDATSATSGRTLHDWNTFRTGGVRLMEYLHHVGYNGVIVSALADGSTIYPSNLVQPTPRHDDGVFFASAQDPVRKDVLEMMFRLCNREQVRLIPSVQFTAPLATLEQLLRSGDPSTEGIAMVGVDGQPWTVKHSVRQGLAPYYNPLNPKVQQAMLDVIDELVDRYHAHESFGGLAIQLSADGYTQFPGVEWGMDAETITRFEQQTSIDLRSAGDDPRARASVILANYRPTWIAWRSQQLAAWYRRVGDLVQQRKPGTNVYLLGGDMLRRPELERELKPTLPKRISVDQLWSAVGIEPSLLRNLPGLVLLRPHRQTPVNSLSVSGVDLEFNSASEWDDEFITPAAPGWLFFHPPQETRLASFETKSPFRKTYSRIVMQASPGGSANRQRFAHALARHDATILADGGWLLPLGQEDELRDLIAAYRSLPAAPFDTLSASTAPVTIRTHADSKRSYLYLVNDSPWKATVTLAVEAPAGCRLDPLGASRRFPPLQIDGDRQSWTIDLAPYDVVAGAFSSPAARISQPSVRLPTQATDALDTRIGELWARAATLKNPPQSHVVANADFEVSTPGSVLPVDWELTSRAGASGKLDESQRHGGRYGMSLSAGPAGAELLGKPVSMSATGRVSLSVWLRVADEQQQPGLRLGVRGNVAGRDWARTAYLGGAPDARPMHATWTQYVLEFPDLPGEALDKLRVSFELVGPGQVWIDDVELWDLDFSEVERLELSKIITAIEYQRKAGELAEALRMLEGYWPRFLRAYVPFGDQPIVRSPVKTIPAAQEKPAAPGAARPAAEADRKSNYMERFKRFIPRWSR